MLERLLPKGALSTINEDSLGCSRPAEKNIQRLKHYQRTVMERCRRRHPGPQTQPLQAAITALRAMPIIPGWKGSLGISWHAPDSIASDHNIRSYIHMQNNHSNRIEFFVTEISFLCLTFRLAALSETWENDRILQSEPSAPLGTEEEEEEPGTDRDMKRKE